MAASTWRRKRFDKAALTELAASIRQRGVLQQIIARGIAEDRFEIVAGERRWLSAMSAGLVTVPAIVHTHSGRGTTNPGAQGHYPRTLQ